MIYIDIFICGLILILIKFHRDMIYQYHKTAEYMKSACEQLIDISLEQNSLILRSGPEQPETGYYYITYKCQKYLSDNKSFTEGNAWFYGDMLHAINTIKEKTNAEQVMITGRWAITEEEYNKIRLNVGKLLNDDINKLFGLED